MSMRFGMYTEVNYIMVLLLFDVYAFAAEWHHEEYQRARVGYTQCDFIHVLTSH